nr:SagB/ThcOx family dehydrogenase [Actinopolyspora biskrensis]
MARVGLVEVVGDDGADALPQYHGEWSTSELAVHARSGRGGKQKVRRSEIPDARLQHAEVLHTIPLLESELPSKPLDEVLSSRRSIRDFATTPLTLDRLAAFLGTAARVRGWLGEWTWQTTRRPSASGGARHSTELYLVVRDVTGLEPGAYHYDPFTHELHQLQHWNDEHDELQRRFLCGPMLVDTPPPVSLYLASYFRRIQCKYGAMTLSLIYREVGCLLQTLYLVATDLDLAPCATALTESDPSPGFLGEHRDQFVHSGNFALGTPAAVEPAAPGFHPLGS